MDNLAIHDKTRSMLISKLREFQNEIDGIEKSAEEIGKDKFTNVEIKSLNEICKRMDISTNEDIFEVLKEKSALITEWISKLKFIEIFIAFEPTISFEEDLVNKISTDLKIDFAYKIEKSDEVIVGVIVDFEGKRFDYSFSKEFEYII